MASACVGAALTGSASAQNGTEDRSCSQLFPQEDQQGRGAARVVQRFLSALRQLPVLPGARPPHPGGRPDHAGIDPLALGRARRPARLHAGQAGATSSRAPLARAARPPIMAARACDGMSIISWSHSPRPFRPRCPPLRRRVSCGSARACKIASWSCTGNSCDSKPILIGAAALTASFVAGSFNGDALTPRPRQCDAAAVRLRRCPRCRPPAPRRSWCRSRSR
ncbi:MAG: hypothetical protein MZV49_17625 [Rhodopseudomonas palustris]|nr:hypothetical protein [Rhodopseudomonas palustris]